MGTDTKLTTRIESRNHVTSVAMTGELDMATVPTLNEQLSALESDGSTAIVVDIRELRFIDSSGLHALVQAHQRFDQDGQLFVVVGANPFFRRLCEITGTRFLLDAKGTAELLGRFTGDGSAKAKLDGEADGKPHA